MEPKIRAPEKEKRRVEINENVSVKLPLWIKLSAMTALFAFVPLLFIAIFSALQYSEIFSVLFERFPQLRTTAAREEVNSLVTVMQTRLAVLAGFLSILLLAGIIILPRLLVNPVRSIIYGIRNLEKLNFSYRVRIDSNDEFGEAAREFNKSVKFLGEIAERERAIARAKSDFISIAAHQLRTPLSAIKWSMSMTFDNYKKTMEPQDLKVFEEGYLTVDRAIKLVGDLLNVARIEEGKFGYDLKTINFSQLTKKSFAEQKIIAEQKKIDISLFMPNRKLLIEADPERLSIALNSIVENALNYTGEGGKVSVSVKPLAEFLKITVQDTGIGIPDKEKGKLFSKFFRASNAIRKETRGSGLGLFVAKNIIEAHGGEISVKSKEGRGTTVSISIPFMQLQRKEKRAEFGEFAERL